VLIADFNITFFLNKSEVLKLEQKTKLNSAENGMRARENRGHGEEFEDFLQSLESVDFNNRGLDK